MCVEFKNVMEGTWTGSKKKIAGERNTLCGNYAPLYLEVKGGDPNGGDDAVSSKNARTHSITH